MNVQYLNTAQMEYYSPEKTDVLPQFASGDSLKLSRIVGYGENTG